MMTIGPDVSNLVMILILAGWKSFQSLTASARPFWPWKRLTKEELFVSTSAKTQATIEEMTVGMKEMMGKMAS